MTRVRLMSKGVEPESSCSFRRGAAFIPGQIRGE
jgi:hypothetical protein